MTKQKQNLPTKEDRQKEIEDLIAQSKAIPSEALLEAIEKEKKEEQERKVKQIQATLQSFNRQIDFHVGEIRRVRFIAKENKKALDAILAKRNKFINTGKL